MRFREFKYEKFHIEAIDKEYRELIQRMDRAKTFKEVEEAVDRINCIRNDLESRGCLMGIRYSLDTQNEFNQKEIANVHRLFPKLEEFDNEFYKSLLRSKYKEFLREKLGEQIFRLAKAKVNTYSEEIREDLKEESDLLIELNKIIATIKMDFKGEKNIIKYFQSEERNIRKEANEIYWNANDEKAEEIEDIFHRLVKVRDRMAKKLGFEDYVELAYLKMHKIDYDFNMVGKFRKGIKEKIVPLNMILHKSQKRALGVDKLKYFDKLVKTKGGGSKLKGDISWLIENTRRVFNELSPETSKFFNEMIDRGLMDLESKEGKSSGAYASYIHNEKAPFIFANLKELGADVKTLMHEGGHAFQLYMSREYDVKEYRRASVEIMETHSMSMELLTWPFMESFFEDDVDKYKFRNISMAIEYIIMTAKGDEFEEYVYRNPEATKEERRRKWLEIEREYEPDIDYGGIEPLEKGIGWISMRQTFNMPFYLIGYAFAQISAFQFWIKAQDDREGAWTDYVNLCRSGGSKSFFELLEIANLKNPFNIETFQWMMPSVKKYISEHVGIND